VNVFEHLRIDGLAFGFDVRDLAADHSIDSAGGGRNFCKDGGAALSRGGRRTDRFERQRQESVTSEDGNGFAEFFVASGLASPEVIIVQRRQVIVNQGVGMDEFDGAGGMKRGRDVGSEDARRLETQDGTNPLSTGEDAVTHCRMDGRGLCRCQRKKPLERGIDSEAVLFEKWRKFHR
jgi:hypothetical protein